MSHDQPSVLVVDDSPHFRHYLSLTFSRALWSVYKWDPQKQALDVIERLPCESLTAAIADWNLGKGNLSGLEVLATVRKRNSLAACVLYTIQAREEEWKLAREDARNCGILALDPGSATPMYLYERVLHEVKRLRNGFEVPRQTWEEHEAWIQPEPDPPDLRLAQAVDSVGKNHLVPIIQDLFPERGPQRPICYTFLSSGFSGASVFLLKNPLGMSPGPRYILKVAPGNEGFETLHSERLRFQKLILGSTPQSQKLIGYVAEEVRPTMDRNEPAAANDAWFGIAYREVGNGIGRVMSFRDLYLELSEGDQERRRYRQLALFLDRLYSDCLGHWYQHSARAANRKLWAIGPGADAYYCLLPKKKAQIFSALDELRPRARILLDRLCGSNSTDMFMLEITAFMEQGRCNSRLGEPTLFHRAFQVLEAGTHGDLHSRNLLAIHRQGAIDPFIIDFSEFEERGHPFYDYARLETDIRLRLMNYEDGSDILDELLVHWLGREERLKTVVEDLQPWDDEPPISSGSVGFIDKGYWLIAVIRALAYQNLSVRLKDRSIQPTKENFSAQYTSALLHRTLISLASTDIVEEKKILGVWLAASLISRLGTIVSRMSN